MALQSHQRKSSLLPLSLTARDDNLAVGLQCQAKCEARIPPVPIAVVSLPSESNVKSRLAVIGNYIGPGQNRTAAVVGITSHDNFYRRVGWLRESGRSSALPIDGVTLPSPSNGERSEAAVNVVTRDA